MSAGQGASIDSGLPGRELMIASRVVGTTDQAPPRGWIRRLLRLPILLYQLRLGWLLGRRFVLLIHTGRRSGKAHSTVLELLRYDDASHNAVVVSDWGTRSQWYKNVVHHPRVRYAVGLREHVGRVEQLSADRAEQQLWDYGERHKKAIRMRMKLMIGEDYDGSMAQYRRLAEKVPVLELSPDTRDVHTP